MTPTLTFAKGLIGPSGPFGRHGAMRREAPASPPRGGETFLGAARREVCQ